ncbi:hypothetical protein [Vibrio atypicus]|jgi:hypothetical protein|uniref:hypothetical protein n=1 Tax=Vibrio atypicus TaxID=558271 RepID=UPI001357D40A|nr:hypothetical protein [Vibrio atypicus]
MKHSIAQFFILITLLIFTPSLFAQIIALFAESNTLSYEADAASVSHIYDLAIYRSR